MLNRRFLLKGAALVALGTVLDGAARPASAATPEPLSRQAPGYFRLMVGDIEVTALYDGGVLSEPKLLHGLTPQEITALLEASCWKLPDGRYPTSINAFLLKMESGVVLVDTGAGTYFGDKGGHLVANMRDAGYGAEQIDTVLLTHLHSDHALGLVDGAGKALFPKATVRVHAADAAYWLSPGAEGRVTEGQRKVLPALRTALAPYQAAGRFKTFAAGEAPAAGVKAVPLAGHTPGQCGYSVRSGGAGILFWGDIAHCMAAQFPHPEVSIDYDVDQGAAIATRQALLSRLDREGTWVAGAHLPFPGIGHVRPAAVGHVWRPALYAVPTAL